MPRYGWRPDLPDHRDILYSSGKPDLSSLPTEVDLRRGPIADIKDQGNLGSCTGNGWAFLIETMAKRHGDYAGPVSRLWVYYHERIFDNALLEDNGAQIRNGAKVLASQGVPLESVWPYDINRFAVLPSAEAFRTAVLHKLPGYRRIVSTSECKHALASGFPVVFGFTVYQSFDEASHGAAPIPGPNERVEGGHCVVRVGYSDRKKAWLCANSWGTDWGMAGYFWLPYAFDSMGLCDDFWTVNPKGGDS